MKELLPLNDNVLLEIEEEQDNKTAGGIILPDSAKEKPLFAKVVAIGNIENSEISVGDTVLYKKYSGTDIEFEENNYILVSYGDILVKVVETEEI